MSKTILGSAALLALAGTACSTPAPASAPPTETPRVHAVFTETAGANLTRCELSGSHLETWSRSDDGAVLYMSAEHEGESCSPMLMVTLDGPAWPGARFPLGEEGVPLYLEESCDRDEVRSWTAASGELVFSTHPQGGLMLHIVDAAMVPSKDPGAAVGRFKANGYGMRVGL